MQEMHEQKMHYLHEFHRQQLHAKDHHIAAMAAEKRADEAERLAGMYDGQVAKNGLQQIGSATQGSDKVGDAEQMAKEREVWRVMGAARQEDDGGSAGPGGESQGKIA